MHTALKLRPMSVSDLDAIMAIERINFPFPWTEGNFKDSMNSGYICLAMEPGKQLMGYAVLMMVLDEAHLLNISIAKSHQGQGWGRYLLVQMMEIGRENGGRNMFLEVRPSNHSALGLYESMGFNEMGIRPGYYPAHNGREDAVLMGMAL
jgi:ribosomal-protein-alanine N-acetyltransferase